MSALETFGVYDDSTTTLAPGTVVDPATIRDSDLLDLCDELFHNRFIAFLNLSNIKVTAEVATALGIVLSRTKGSRCVVQYLKMENCSMTVDVLRAFVESIGPAGTINRLEILDLSKNPFGDAGATLLANALEQWNVATPSAQQLSSSASSNTNNTINANGDQSSSQYNVTLSSSSDTALTSCIRTLELRNCRIGPHGAVAIGNMLGTSAGCRITSLNLDNNGLRHAGITEVCRGLMTNRQLRLLSIADNNINAEGGLVVANTLRANTSLETLQAGKNYLSESVPQIALSLCRRGSCARLLDLSTNRINATMCRAMSQVLEGNQFYVSCLTLEGNPIGDEGLVALYHAIKGTPVQFLDLSDTSLTQASATVLADIVRLCPLLGSLQIDENTIGDEGLAVIAAAVGDSKTLTALNLERCGLGPYAVDVLASSIARRRKWRSLAIAENPNVSLLPLLDALSTCRTLEYLDMSDNNIGSSEDYLRALVAVFSSNDGLKEVILEHNPIAKGFPSGGIMTRALAASLAADAGLISMSGSSPNGNMSVSGAASSAASIARGFGGLNTTGGAGSPSRVNASSSSLFQSTAGGSRATRQALIQSTFKPKWATTTGMDHRSLVPTDDADGADSDGEDGLDIPLVPNTQSLQHAMYPGYGKGRFSAGQSVQQLSNPVSYTIENSRGVRPTLLKSCDMSTELQAPYRRPLKQSPYSLAALEGNKGQLPITEDHLRKKFEELDVDGSGFLNRDEFKRIFMTFQYFGLQPREDEVESIMSKYNMWGNGKVSFDEFCILMLKLAQM